MSLTSQSSSFRGPPQGTSQEFPDEMRDLPRRLFQVLPTASARRERPVTSTPPGGSALLIVSLLALKVIATGSNNWYDHTDWAGTQLLPSPTPGLSSPTAPPSSDSLPSPISRTNYQLVWSDEFNGTSVDASKWNKVGPWGHSVASGWANFSYLTSNVSVANGLATITVHKSGSNWNGGNPQHGHDQTVPVWLCGSARQASAERPGLLARHLAVWRYFLG